MENLNKEFDSFVKRMGDLMTPSIPKVVSVADTCSSELASYVYQNKLKSVTLGISGGLDSAVVAALARMAATKLKKVGYDLKVVGVSIPLSSTNAHKDQAAWVGKEFCDPNCFLELTSWENEIGDTRLLDLIANSLSASDFLVEAAGFKKEDIDRSLSIGNLKSRLRMISLYDIARKTNGLVLGTGNWSEDHAIFFYTLGGDGQVDYSMIKGVGKGFEMPVLAKYLGIKEDIINQSPSDGLAVTGCSETGEGATDYDQIGATYKEVDVIINAYLGNFPKEVQEEFLSFMELDKIKKVIDRHNRYKFKGVGEIGIERGQNGLPLNFK